MRVSRFWELMDGEFGGSYAQHVADSTHISSLGGATAREALAAGAGPREVWLALCDAMEVPEERRLGRDPKSAPR